MPIDIIRLNFRGYKVYIPRDDITHTIYKDWFLEILLNKDYFKNDDENEEIFINEDKNTALSIIETLKNNTLIILPDVSLELLLIVAEKWVIPQYFINQIRERAVYELEKINTEEIDNVVLECKNCKIGFKMMENNIDSCNFHPGKYSLTARVFECCGGEKDSIPCRKGYHTLSHFDLNQNYLKFKKNFKDNVNKKI